MSSVETTTHERESTELTLNNDEIVVFDKLHFINIANPAVRFVLVQGYMRNNADIHLIFVESISNSTNIINIKFY